MNYSDPANAANSVCSSDQDTRSFREQIPSAAAERRAESPSAFIGGRSSGSGSAIKPLSIITKIVSIAFACLLGLTLFTSCIFNGRANKAPEIIADPDSPNTYLLTVYGANGTTVIFETADGSRLDAVIKNDNTLTFKVDAGSLMPVEPLDTSVYEARPKVFVRNEDGSETLLENMPSVMLSVPAITVTYDCPDAIVSEDGSVTVSGHIDYIGTELTIGGEPVSINLDGSFSREIVFEDTGDQTIEIEGRLPGYQIYRHALSVTVNKSASSASLIELPWEYGDTEYSQRVRNSIEIIEVRAKAPVGSKIRVSCDSSNAFIDNCNPPVGDDGIFGFNVTMSFAGDYVIHMTCTTDQGAVSERYVHVQRQPDYASYVSSAWEMNYAAFSYQTRQAYHIKGTVTEIIEDGDYILAKLDVGGGSMLIIEYHNHYASACGIEVGREYSAIYGRPMGPDEETGIPRCYVWFIDG